MAETERFLQKIIDLRSIESGINSRLLLLESRIQTLISKVVVVKGSKDKVKEIKKKIPELEALFKTSFKILKEILEENQKGG